MTDKEKGNFAICCIIDLLVICTTAALLLSGLVAQAVFFWFGIGLTIVYSYLRKTS